MKKSVDWYENQIKQYKQELDAANPRINVLEAQLKESRERAEAAVSEVARLRSELSDALQMLESEGTARKAAEKVARALREEVQTLKAKLKE